MRNIVTVIMGIALLISLFAGCGSSADVKSTEESSQESFGTSVTEQEYEETEAQTGGMASATEDPTDEAGPIQEDASDPTAVEAQTASGILVLYFSAADNDGIDAVSAATVTGYDGSEYGAAQLAAQWVADYTGGDISAILTEETYPEEYEAMADMAKEERDDNVHPALRSSIDQFDQYDTVFLVYPIWWYQMPMAMYSLTDQYDFSGKTVLVATIHEGSGLSGTIEDLMELEPGANIINNGFTERAGNIADSKGDIESWLEEVAEYWRS